MSSKVRRRQRNQRKLMTASSSIHEVAAEAAEVAKVAVAVAATVKVKPTEAEVGADVVANKNSEFATNSRATAKMIYNQTPPSHSRSASKRQKTCLSMMTTTRHSSDEVNLKPSAYKTRTDRIGGKLVLSV